MKTLSTVYGKLSLVVVSWVCVCGNLFSQQDFNHYQTLQAKGAIPEDFTNLASAKVEKDLETRRTNLTPLEEKVFLQGIHYSIDQILHSGSVIYGDEISLYVQKVAENLLRNQPELLRELRFYTIKSNETNALSTDQGIVFVTTGLISQLTSEAQLAYVLAHEIAHYTEKHVVETFSWKRENQYESHRIESLSSYSHEHEFAADKIGLKLYYDAGYNMDEVIPTFDVLMYSYLPFDEVVFPKSYLESQYVFIPDNLCATKKYPIKTEEDYDDSRSSHPNIEKRKAAIEELLNEYTNRNSVVFSQGESSFFYVRNLARFESVRTDVIQGNFGQAIYSIFLLEHEYPESVYLKRMKALCWLGLAQFREAGNHLEAIPSNSDFEGESAALYFLLRKINNETNHILALRTVYDIRKSLPEDQMIKGIFERLLHTLAESEHFKPNNYARISFSEALEKAAAKKDSVLPVTEAVELSKYEKIKQRKNQSQSLETVDSSKFYAYAIPDILNDSVTMEMYHKYKKAFDKEEESRISYSKLTPREKYEYDKRYGKEKNPLAMGLSECVVVQPSASEYKKNDAVDLIKSEKLEQALPEMFREVAGETGVEIHMIDHENLVTNGSAGFNERSTLYALLEQTAHYGEADRFPVDFDALKTIEINYGTSNILYVSVQHQYQPDINWALIGYSAFFLPTLPFTLLTYVPITLLQGHRTEINMIILDCKTGEVTNTYQAKMHSKARKYNLANHFHYALNLFSQTPDK